VLYAANGNRSFPKESLEVFGGGLAARLDDFRELTIHAGSKRSRVRSRLSADKGHRGIWEALAAHLTGSAPPPMTWNDIEDSTRATLAAHRSLLTGEPVLLDGAGE
jgi:polar amino acid transport system substrate-binding protein